jgi:hypothetical protein
MFKNLLSGVLLSLLLGLVGCCNDRCKADPDKVSQDTPAFETFRGYVLELNQAEYSGGGGNNHCTNLLFQREDGTVINFHVHDWPPVWKGMRAEINLKKNDACGYEVIFAKEL